MKITLWHVNKGMESRFDLRAALWAYRSRYERWFIIRVFGIYFWFVPKEHQVL